MVKFDPYLKAISRWVTPNGLGKHLVVYCQFLLFTWLVHLITISVITFFHFVLDHKIPVIENWILDRGWTILIFVKGIGFFVATEILFTWSKERSPLRQLLMNRIFWWGRDHWIMVIGMLLLFISWGQPLFRSGIEFDLFKILLAFIGNGVNYLGDIVLIVALDQIFPMKRREHVTRLLLFPILFYFASASTFSYADKMDASLMINFLFMLVIYELSDGSLAGVLGMIVIFLIPLAIIFGVDPMWSSQYSFMLLQRPMIAPAYFMLVIFLTAFFLIKRFGIHTLKRYLTIRIRARRL